LTIVIFCVNLALHMAGEWILFVDVAEGPVTEKIETCLVV